MSPIINRTTAIQDRSVWLLASVKTALGISDASHDVRIGRLMIAAKEQADSYCSNPFEDVDADTDVVTELAIPSVVEEGVLRWIAVDLGQSFVTPNINPQGQVVVEAKTSSVQMKWGQGKFGQGSADQYADIERRYWSRHRLIPGF